MSEVYSLCKENGVSILPHFQRYISDKNIYARLAVETAAAEFKSPPAKAILLQLVRDDETTVAETALRDFLLLYPLKELSKSDAGNLNDGLVVRAKRGDASGLSLLLLAYHSQTPETMALLNSLREPKETTVGLINSLPVARSVIADVTLAQLDDQAAGGRVAAIIQSGPVASAVGVVVSIPYMNDPRLLLQATELLKDTRITQRVRGGMGFSGPGTTVPEVTYHRVCDLALITFARRDPAAPGLDTSIGDHRPFTPTELNNSYTALHAYYSAMAKLKPSLP